MYWFRVLALLLLASSAAAQTNPGFVDGLPLGASVVPAGQSTSLNAAFTSKADVASPVFTGVSTFGGARVQNNGSAAAPSLAVGAATATTGFYAVSTTGLGLSVNGVNKLDFGASNANAWTLGSATNLVVPNGVTMLQTGSAGSPAYNFVVSGSAVNSGMYVTSGGAPHNVGVAVDGVNMVTFGPNPGVTCTVGQVNAATMTVANGIVTHC